MAKSALSNATGNYSLDGLMVYKVGAHGWEILYAFGPEDTSKNHPLWDDTRKRECPRNHERIMKSTYQWSRGCRFCGEVFPLPTPKPCCEECSCGR